jgi:nucleoside triphosphate pyrophosphatase
VRLVLASASPARLSVLRGAGIEPVVRVSGVDEDAVAAALVDPKPAEVVTALAVAKAEAVLPLVAREFPDAVVIGCDSMLLTADGSLEGKPHTVEVARERWRRQAGTSGTLITGHAVLLLRDGEVVARGAASEPTTVRFGRPDEADLEAYLATGEPLQVAGAFTLEGLGGWFIDGLDGDPSSVLGISLPLTRRLLGEVGVRVSDMW